MQTNSSQYTAAVAIASFDTNEFEPFVGLALGKHSELAKKTTQASEGWQTSAPARHRGDLQY